MREYIEERLFTVNPFIRPFPSRPKPSTFAKWPKTTSAKKGTMSVKQRMKKQESIPQSIGVDSSQLSPRQQKPHPGFLSTDTADGSSVYFPKASYSLNHQHSHQHSWSPSYTYSSNNHNQPDSAEINLWCDMHRTG